MARSDVLVSTDWAESNLDAADVVFVEVDEDTSAYDDGHITGAIKLDWRTDLQDPVKRDFVDAQQFSKLLSDRGIANDDTVILYGGNNNWFAGYAYWYFKLYGHENVKLLDGGRKKWELDGRQLSTETVNRPATSYTAKQADNTIRAFRDEVLAAISAKNLVDVRSPDEFSGKILAPAHLPQEQSQRPGHIPGAIKLDWRTDLQDPVKRDFVDAQQFSKLLSERGIANDDTVILYGGNNNWFAAYAYWYFKLYGHENVKLLDGGRKKWELDGRPLSKGSVSRSSTSYSAATPDNTIRAFRDEVISAINIANLVDVRSPDEFSGKILAPAHLPQEQSQRPGHIPGAINVPWSKAANEDGTFKSDEELATLYADAGLDGTKETIAYCRIGERSSHTWFVLRELLGHTNVKNYDGSWTEYGSLVGAPIELGS
jgi:thiosulfate/3-mercaptopyruvate sulfurtransferase